MMLSFFAFSVIELGIRKGSSLCDDFKLLCSVTTLFFCVMVFLWLLFDGKGRRVSESVFRFDGDEVFSSLFLMNEGAQDFCGHLAQVRDHVDVVRQTWKGESAVYFMKIIDDWFKNAQDLSHTLLSMVHTAQVTGQEYTIVTEDNATSIDSSFSAIGEGAHVEW